MLNQLIKEFFKSKGWNYSEIEGKNVFVFGINGESGTFQCIAEIFEKERRFLFSSIFGTNIPEEKKNAVLDFINALNYKIFLGDFEMNPQTRELRFKTTFSYLNTELTKESLEEIIISNIFTMDTHFQQILNLIFGNPSEEFTPKIDIEK